MNLQLTILLNLWNCTQLVSNSRVELQRIRGIPFIRVKSVLIKTDDSDCFVGIQQFGRCPILRELGSSYFVLRAI